MAGEKSERPRDAASVVVFDQTGGELRIMMGRRQPTQVFMPGKFVFPGGRMDPEDKSVPVCRPLEASEEAKLLCEMKGGRSSARATGLCLAAIREAYEEAGLVIGQQADPAKAPSIEHPSWRAYFKEACAPAPSDLTFFARAITPPGRTRRFDTRFFCIERKTIGKETTAIDGELSDLGWFTLLEIKSLDLAPITRVIIDEFCDRLEKAPLGPSVLPVPFYHQSRGVFHRELVSANGIVGSS